MGLLVLEAMENITAEWNRARVIRARWRIVFADGGVNEQYSPSVLYCSNCTPGDAMRYDGVLI